MFKELCERADEPSVYFQLHAADGAIDDPEQREKANPSRDMIKSYVYMADAGRKAKGRADRCWCIPGA
ncbi:MAG: hypothetical protein ACR2P3_01180 [Geminicoccaceae bacterium]